MLAITSITFFAGISTQPHTSTALSSLIGVSNLTLLQQSLDYFGTQASQNPYTHTWSLAVEEQFYLLFPLLAVRSRSLATATIWSFGLWLYLCFNNQEAAFYLMPARLWEIGTGVLLWKFQHKLPNRAFVAALGLLALLTVMIMPQKYQTISTIATVISTSALITGLRRESPIQNIFKAKVLTGIGKRAYGLYLWHWPMIVISRELWPTRSTANIVTPILTTIILASVSYSFLESPLRKGGWGLKQGLPWIGACAGLITISSIANKNIGIERNYDEFSKKPKNELSGQKCHSSYDKNALKNCLSALTTTNAPRTILIGDSHAAHLRAILIDHDPELIQLTGRNIPNLMLGRGCRESNYCFTLEQLGRQLSSALSPDSLVLFAISPRRLSNVKDPVKRQKRSIHLQSSLRDLSKVVRHKKSKLLLISGLPQVSCRQGESFEGIYKRGGSMAIIEKCSLNKNDALRKNAPLSRIQSNLQEAFPNTVYIFNTHKYICADDKCQLGTDKGELFVWDSMGHLTSLGVKKLETGLIKKIQEL